MDGEIEQGNPPDLWELQESRSSWHVKTSVPQADARQPSDAAMIARNRLGLYLIGV